MHESFLTAPRPLVAVRRLLLAAVATFAVTGSALAASQPAFAAAPIAADDHYSVIADTPLEPPAPGVFANDTGATSVSMTIKVVAGPSHGTVTVTGPGLFRYVPAAGFAGTDAFSYCIVKRAASPACISLDAEVSIDVTKVKAVDDAYSTPVNTPLTVPGPGVLANDTDVLPSMSVAFDPPAHGGLTPGARAGSPTHHPPASAAPTPSPTASRRMTSACRTRRPSRFESDSTACLPSTTITTSTWTRCSSDPAPMVSSRMTSEQSLVTASPS